MNIERIGVVGAGAMGHGIAHVAAQAGFSVTLCDLDERLVGAGLGRIRDDLDKGVELGKLAAEEAEAVLQRVATTTDLGELAENSNLIVEAIPEVLELKKKVLGEVEVRAATGTLLATNTSSLSIAAMAADLEHPENLIGMHFFNPVHLMKLLEIIVHAGTGGATLDAARTVGEAMGKTCIVVKDFPGFVTSRLGVVLGLEAMRMLEQGVASVEDIDTAMELGYGHPMGPLKLTDLVGLDIRLAIAAYLHEELGTDAFRPPEILRRMVDEGRLGKKSGSGFYDWE